MGFFSFLTPGEQDAPPDLERPVRVPKGAKVRQPGKDYSLADQEWAAEGDDIIPGDGIPTAKAGVDFDVDKRQNVRKAHADIQNAYGEALKVVGQAGLGGGSPFTPQDANDLRQIRDALSMRGTKEAGVADNPIKLADDLRVIATRQTVPPEYAKLLHGAADKLTNAYKAQGELEALRQPGQALAVNDKDISGRQQYLAAEIAKRQEQLKTAGSLRAPQLQQELKSLREEEGRMSLATKGTEGLTPPEPEPVTKFMAGLGIKDAVPKVHQALQKVGIPPEEWGNTNVDPSAGVMRVLAELDPNGDFARLIAKGIADAKMEDANQSQTQPQGKGQTDPGIARTERAIQNKEQEMRALYATLRESPFMRTWPGIILYVLVGMLTQNPAFAARLIGGVGNRAAVNDEIKGIQHQLARLDRELARRERDDAYTQREAARRLQRKEDQVDQRKWDLSKMMLQHQLIIKRNASRNNPETALMKKLAADFQRNLGMASKFSGEMQNEFADPKLRESARQNFNLYMRRAAEIDSQINQMGGSEAEQPQEMEE